MTNARGLRVACVVGCFALFGAGCGESHSGPDAGMILFEAGTPPVDSGAGMDAGTSASDIGHECASTGDCAIDCIDESSGFPGGYCTADCSGGEPCPDGSTCTPVGRRTSVCLADCDPSATGRTCRAGYGCASDFMLPGPVCLPGCQDDTDCAMGLTCDPTGGFAGEGVCFDPDSALGDACTGASDCPAGGFCYGERFSGWPGGACIAGGCDVTVGTGCDGDAVCLPGGGGGGGGVCIDGCALDEDCRAGYRCTESTEYPGRRYCGPGCTTNAQCSGGRVCNPAIGTCDDPFDPGELGQACSGGGGACSGGTCAREFESGFPGSYCVFVGCDPTAAPGATGCPMGGVCVDGSDGSGVCLLGCEGTPDCPRDGYDCLPSDRADPMSPLACMPACTTDMSCANDGFVCNDGTGLCRPPFAAASLREACASAAECEGGVCLTEPALGFPGGLCAFPGCRLSGMGPSEMCPTGSVCVDDETGDPSLGVCIESCAVSATSCRAGYACVATSMGSTEGACRAACTASDCAGGRACNTMTGLCE